MTRQIKFRAWVKDWKEMFEVIMLTFPVGEKEFILSGKGGSVSSKDCELMQFTGLMDKNGKEIYEGDIVKYKYLSGFSCEDEDYKIHGIEQKPKVVEFKDGEFYPKETYNYCEDGFYASRYFDFEIIGNIYENPELLTNPTPKEE